MAKCRTCDNKIAANAKICPQCGEQKPHFVGYFNAILTLIAVVVIAGILSGD